MSFDFIFAAVSILLSAWVIFQSHRITRDARKEFAARANNDPVLVAGIMGRLGWLERRRLAKEIASMNQEPKP